MSKNIYSASKYLINLCLLLQDERQLKHRNLCIIFLLFGWCSFPSQKKKKKKWYSYKKNVFIVHLKICISKSRAELRRNVPILFCLFVRTKAEDSYEQCQTMYHITPMMQQHAHTGKTVCKDSVFCVGERPGFFICNLKLTNVKHWVFLGTFCFESFTLQDVLCFKLTYFKGRKQTPFYTVHCY